MTDPFRKLYGDELADQVEKLKKKPSGVEVMRPKKPAQAAQPDRPATQTADSEQPNWWDR